MSKSTKPLSEIDRLIELASDEKPRAAVQALPQHSLSLENEKDSGPSMWRVLLQLRVLLPYLARVLPLVERGLLGTNITGQSAQKIETSNLDRGITEVGEAQRDLNNAVKAQTAELRELQEKVAVLTKSVEESRARHEEMDVSLSALKKLTETSVTVTIALLLILTVLVGLLLFRRW